MHPLMPSVLLRAGRLDELGTDAEPEPPDAELGQAAERRGEGRPIVRADALGEPVGAKESAEDLLRGRE